MSGVLVFEGHKKCQDPPRFDLEALKKLASPVRLNFQITTKLQEPKKFKGRVLGTK